MSQPLDIAYVELRARGERVAARQIKNALDSIKRDVDHASDEIGDDLETALNGIFADFGGLEAEVKKVFHSIEREARDVGETLTEDIAAGAQVAQAEVDDMADHMVRDLHRVDHAARDAADELVKVGVAAKIGQALAGAGGGIGNILGSIGSFGFAHPLFAAIVALLPAIFALAGSLVDLLGLLAVIPASIGVLVAAIAPLITAFHGIGDAIGAVASGDVDKINEALKDLAPSARSFVRELGAAMPLLHTLRVETQEAFFRPFVGVISILARNLFPALRVGMHDVAMALGDMFRQLGLLLADKDIVEDIGDVFETTARVISQFAPHLVDFIGIMFGVMEHGLPFVERMADGFGRLLDRFGAFISESLKTGSFEDFIENAFTAIKDLGDLAGAVFHLIIALFGDTGDEGHTLLQALTDITNQFAKFFESAEGQRALQDFLNTLPAIITVIAAAFKTLEFLIVLPQRIADAVIVAIHTVTDWGAAIGDFVQKLIGWLSQAWDAVVNFFNRAMDVVSQVPGRIGDALAALPTVIRTLLVNMFDQMFTLIGFSIGLMINIFMTMPGRVASIVHTLWSGAVGIFERGVGAVLSIVLSLGLRLLGAFNDMWNRAHSSTSAGINGVIAFFRDLPPRVLTIIRALPVLIALALANAGSVLFDVGRNIIMGLINGIKSVVGAAIDIVKRAIRDIVHGAEAALGAHSPSRVFMQLGKFTMQGYAIGIEDSAGIPERAVRRTIIPDVIPGVAAADVGRSGSVRDAINQALTGITAGAGGANGGMDEERLGRVLARELRAALQNVVLQLSDPDSVASRQIGRRADRLIRSGVS